MATTRVKEDENIDVCQVEMEESSCEMEDERKDKSGNKIPSVIIEDTSVPLVRTPSKVGNKDFEVHFLSNMLHIMCIHLV